MAKRQGVLKIGVTFKEGEAFFAANPKDLPKESFNRKILVAAHEQSRVATEHELQESNGKLFPEKKPSGSAKTTHSPPTATSANSPPISSLKEIFLPQLELDKRHHGRVLFGTFCVRPFKTSSSVVSVLADKSGKAVRLSISSLPPTLSSQKEIEARFATGQKAAVKEPSFKLSSDGKVTICVEKRTDLALLDDSNEEIVFELDDVLEDLIAIRAEGNRLFALQKWKEAIVHYSACITQGSAVTDAGGGDVKEVNQCLLLSFSNRSEAWLRLFAFKSALDDASKALKIDPTHQKSASRRDRAWRGFVETGLGKVPTSSKSIDPPETIIVVERQPTMAVKGLASKTKPTTPKAKTNKRNASSSNGSSKAKDSKPIARPPTPPENAADDSKNKPLANPKVKGGESKNLSLARSTPTVSKVGPTVQRKSISPTPKAAKVELLETESIPPLPTIPTPTPTELPNASAAPSARGAPEGEELATASDEDKVAAAALHLWNQSSDSENDSSSPPPHLQLAIQLHAGSGNGDGDGNDDVQEEEAVIEPAPTNANADVQEEEAVIERATIVADAARRDSQSPDAELRRAHSPPDTQKGMAGAIDIELPTFAAWVDGLRSSADALLSQGNWAEAVKVYNTVTGFPLPQKNKEKVIQTLLMAYSHRSEAWIWMGDFEKSLRDAHSAIKIVDNYPQSVVGIEGKHTLNEIRRGRAFHGLGDYEKACDVFQRSFTKSPNDKSILDLLKKSRVALEQSQKGIYDLDDYFVNGCRGAPPPCTDFVGPVEIRRVLGKGRGLFVTEDLEAGDLLLASNPLVVVRWRLNADEDEDYSQVTTKWRRRGGDNPLGLYDFVKRLSRLSTEQQVLQLFSLTGGNPDDELEIPDIALFSQGPYLSPPQGFEGYAAPGMDLQGLQRRVLKNAMEGGLNPLDSCNILERDNEEAIVCAGVWALPSFMNHSCVPNCHMIDVGNTMFVRASRDLQEGEELTRAYFDVYQNSLDRQKLCAEWNFSCSCERCVLEKSLAEQNILPLHEYRTLLERVQEENLRRAERERSINILLPNPQPALMQLRKFADWCDGLLYRADGLGNKEKAWIGASHIEAYESRFHGSKDRNQFILGLENLLEFMTNTAIVAVGGTSDSALERAAVLLRLVEEVYGQGSQTFQRIETRVLDLYHTVYGSMSKEVLFSMSRLMIRSV